MYVETPHDIYDDAAMEFYEDAATTAGDSFATVLGVEASSPSTAMASGAPD